MKLFLTILLLCLNSISKVNSQTIQTVANVDLNKYAGKWYEIASYQQRFQKGCTCTTAEYTATNKRLHYCGEQM